jgi:hypothetical protein
LADLVHLESKEQTMKKRTPFNPSNAALFGKLRHIISVVDAMKEQQSTMAQKIDTIDKRTKHIDGLVTAVKKVTDAI